ncbi:MAG: putative membrane-bound dehydrogenase-like protein [Planctomycetota bacterium]|jgi:putative membrane-bound dehydrogenase-like protein
MRFAFIFAVLSAALMGQDKSSDVTTEFTLPDGLVVTLWATTPQVLNPTNMDVDTRGRIWVTEAVNYRDFRNPTAGRVSAPKGDRVRILEDTNGDGVCDSSKVFVQDKDLVSPLGIAHFGNRVFVSCSPHLFIYTDTDGDDVSDKKEILLTGFGGRDHDHGLHAVVGGPDGRLWFNVGNAGRHVVTDGNGKTLRSGSIYDPGTGDNEPGLKSDDGHVWVGGLALSMKPDGTDLQVHSHNFRNCYEVGIDAFGDLWQNDNDDDGNRSCRIAHLPRGANLGYCSADGSRMWRADKRPGQVTAMAHWHQDDPGVFPGGEITGAGAPTGLLVHETGALGKDYENTVFSADAGRGCVFLARPKLTENGFTWKSTEFIKPKDKEDRWFRPSDIVVGADGALYISDWYDSVVGGHLMRDKSGVGRIYRVARRHSDTRPQIVDLTTIGGAIKALTHPLLNTRYAAGEALRSFGDKATVSLSQVLADENPAQSARALWVLAASKSGQEFCIAALEAKNPRLRLVAMRALLANDVNRNHVLTKMAVDAHPIVRAEVALHLRGVPFDESQEIIKALAKSLDATNRYYIESFGLACEGIEGQVYSSLLATLGDQPLKWSDSFAAIAWRLHPDAAIPAFSVRALSAQINIEERRRAIDAIGFSESPDATAAMVAVATRGPEDLRSLARFWLLKNDAGIWRGRDALSTIGGERPRDAKPAWTSGIMKNGLKTGSVDLKGVKHLWLVATNGGNGNSCDWANWIEPTLVGPGGSVPLTDLAWIEAQADWGRVSKNKNCAGGPLRIEDQVYRNGIGTHASSEVYYALPRGKFTRLDFKVGPDDGGAKQAIAATSVDFHVFTMGYVKSEQTKIDIAKLLHQETSKRARRALAKKMAEDPGGAMALIGLAARDQLPESLRRPIQDVIHRNEDFTVRALAGKWFPKVAQGGQEFPTLPELLKLKGDPRSGSVAFFSKRAGCSKCHIHDGRGIDVGPDLTAIHSKYARAELLDNILNPSAAIAFGYEGWMVETKNGEVNTGFLLADGPVVILKNTTGRRILIPKDEIVFRRRLKLSTMPDNVALGLTPQELVDVAAFLKEDALKEPQFGPEIALFNGKDLSGWTFHLNDPQATMQDVWSVEDGVLQCRGNPVGYLRTVNDYTNFELTLEWRFDPKKGPGNSGVLLRLVNDDKVWPKSIEAQLMHRNAGDIWNIENVQMTVAEGRTKGRRTAKRMSSNEKRLGEWNRYRIRMDGGRLTLEVNGVVQNRAWDCAEDPGKIALQSEGAAIEFRNVRLRPIL